MKRTTADRAWRPWEWIIPAIAVLLAILAVTADAYDPLTEEQARAYIERDPAGAVRDVIAMDYIEHVTPKVAMPEGVLVVTEKDVVLEFRPAYIELTLEPYLDYRIALKGDTVKGVVPRARWWPPILAVVVGSLAATLLEATVPLAPVSREALAFGGGAALGLTVWLLLK